MWEAEPQVSSSKSEKLNTSPDVTPTHTYGGCANGIPRNLDVLPELVPVMVALSNVTVGAASGLPNASPAWKERAASNCKSIAGVRAKDRMPETRHGR